MAPLVTITLPLPPSTNNLYVNVPGRGRVPSTKYRAWKRLVAPMLSRVPPVTIFPVAITLTIRGGKGWRSNADIANREKAAVDALVEHNILPDDSTKYVRRIIIQFEEPADRRPEATILICVTPMAVT